MVYNLKAGVMATTTMVGSAFAYTKTQEGTEDIRGAHYKNQGRFVASSQKDREMVGGNQEKEKDRGPSKQYKDTFDQMMIWK